MVAVPKLWVLEAGRKRGRCEGKDWLATRTRRCFPPPPSSFSHTPPFLLHSNPSAFVINEAIQARTVRLVIKDECSSGPPTSIVVSRQEALAKAKEAGLDLVLGKHGGREGRRGGTGWKGITTDSFLLDFKKRQQQPSTCANSPSIPPLPPSRPSLQ